MSIEPYYYRCLFMKPSLLIYTFIKATHLAVIIVFPSVNIAVTKRENQCLFLITK